METKPERLQKILAAAGLASRRKSEELIAAGVVSVNGHVITEPGTKADPRVDEIRVDGKLLRGPERHVYLAMYKPKGHMTTVSDPEGRPTVMDLIKGVDERVFPVGRLDYMSEGLLLLTNDGDLMSRLTSAGSHLAKTYMVKVSGKPADEAIDKLRNGIMLPPEPGLTGVRGKKQPGTERRSFAVLTQPATIQLAVDQENPWYEVTLTEGRNRQIRRMFEQIGHHIEKIKRIRYGSLTLDLEPGEFRHLTPKEVNQLRKSLETPFKPKPVKLKVKDLRHKTERPERRTRVDAARFVKGRRGKPSADGAAATSSFRPASTERRPYPNTRPQDSRPQDTRPDTRPEFTSEDRDARTPGRPAASDRGASSFGDSRTRRPFVPREDRGQRGPRGPEFAREAPYDDRAAGKRPYTRKPGAGFAPKPSGDFADRPKRPYTRKPADGFASREGGFEKRDNAFAKREGGYQKREGGFSKREGGYEKRPHTPRRDDTFSPAPEKRNAPGGFGFSKFSKPKFVKPSKHRDLGSDKTENFSERPYSKERRPSAGGGFAKKPGGFTGDRKFSKGPGKPGGSAPRGEGFNRGGKDFKPRPGSGFKPSGGFKRSSGGFSPGSSTRRPPSTRPPSRNGGPSRPPRRREDE